MTKRESKSATSKGARARRQEQDSAPGTLEEPTPGVHSSALTWRDERNTVQPLTHKRAIELVSLIFDQCEDEEKARALIELITGTAYEPDSIKRDELAVWTTHQAYRFTREFSERAEAFATHAATRP
jgi:hypothetical protein